jgi:hypothetical protein
MAQVNEQRKNKSTLRSQLIHVLVAAAIAASAITAVTTGLTIWISTLPAITPVSLSLVFRSWERIIEFNLWIWLWTFSIAALAAAVLFAHWFYVDRELGQCSGCPDP